MVGSRAMHKPRLLLSLALLWLSGCGTTVYFETEVQGASTVKGNSLGGLLSAFPGISSFSNMDFSQSQDFKNQGVKKEDVKSVKMKSMTLKISSPSSANFDWLSSI